jgi:hypothetical protein
MRLTMALATSQATKLSCRTILCSLLFGGAIFANEACTPLPWLTGSLLSPAGTVVPEGHGKLKNYLFITVDTGRYDSDWKVHSQPSFYRINPRLNWRFGLTEWMDIQVIPQLFYNITQGESSVHVGDFPVALEFQLIDATAYKWFPGVKLSLREIFPTGKYQKLNPRKKRTDATGNGSFGSQPGLVFYKLYALKDAHFLTAKLTVDYAFYTSVHVKGFNEFGGGYGTNGKVCPGSFLQTLLSFEYTIDENWVFAIDGVYYHRNKNSFSGTTSAPVGGPSSDQISFAPALEYNYSDNFGIIAGVWATIWGRNATQFTSGVVNFEYKY